MAFPCNRFSNPQLLILMKNVIIFLSLAALLFASACSNSNQSGDGAEATDGWTALFDGATLNGWRGYNGVEIENIWVVEEGTMHLVGREKGSPHVNIITEKQYDDFDFRFGWKIEEGTNSGAIFHIGEGPKQPYLTGPEYQVLDNLGFRNGKGNPVTSAEWTAGHYAIEEPLQDATKPIGEWNEGRIVVRGNQVEYFLNGVKTAEYEMHSDQWNEQIENSKFKTWDDFATLGKGHIGLQDHGHRVWFRDLKIKEL
ncbi:MAG: hypothetical protein CBD18_01245 [Opitutales bacterium TMED158]|nr:MAG: hypothetical protein CBD18_01245 [Opitutales bacterium TMED158]